MNEFELIAQLTAKLAGNDSVVVGVGDDCAVLRSGDPHFYTLFKTDAVVGGIHFDEQAQPQQIGHKALARCLSDVAAMGGTATAALVTLGLPDKFDAAVIKSIYTGMNSLAERFGVAIVGGETVHNPERLFISVALLGKVAREKCILRSGAKRGDAIFVTGELGGSREDKHLDFEPRLKEAQWLAAHFEIHAMIDLSDGLAGDLRHILDRSGGLGAELLTRAIPINRKVKSASAAKPPLLAALTDGEDFELLFTVSGREAVPLLDGWKKEFPSLRLSCVGKITETPGVTFRDKDGIRKLEAHGYVHFP